MPIIGDTVKLHVEFRTFAGVLTDPESITLTVYDLSRKSVAGPVGINSTHRISTGVYEYLYIIPAGYSSLYYEFIGNPEGLPAVSRGTISCNWQ